MRRVLLCFAIVVLAGPLGAMPAAAEKVQEATGKVAPKAGAADQASERRKASAEWIKRCDKLKGDPRMACLEEVRTEIVQRFDKSADGRAASGAGEK